MLAATLLAGCGDDAPATGSATTSEPATTAAATPGPTPSTTSTTAAPAGPTVVWRETLSLGSTVSVRHLAVSNGVFLASTEADFRRPGEVTISIFLSPDGENWSEVELPPEDFADVAFFEMGGGPAGFIATGARIDDSGGAAGFYVWTSPDGEEWSSSELVLSTVPEPASPFIFNAIDSPAVGATPTHFVAIAEVRRNFDVAAILDAYAPNFEWPEFASMGTETLPNGDVRLTIGGEGGNDFVATFSELGIDSDEMPIGDAGSDFISLAMGSVLWTSANGVDWMESRGPEVSSTSPLASQLAVDVTTAGLFVHCHDYLTEESTAWHSADGSNWVEVDLPGTSVADWSGGLYSFDQRGHLWISADGASWTNRAGPEAMADARDLMPTAGTPNSPIAVVGIRPDAAWQDATVPESWVAVSSDGATWWEARGVEAFGMPVWPEAVASEGDRIVIGLVGEPQSADPYSSLWLGTAG
jgi:hypothetical protein